MKLERPMRKTTLILAGIIFLVGNISIAHAIDYEIIQITDNDATSNYFQDTHPAINNNGQINWVSWDSQYMYGAGVKMFFDGVNIIELPSPTGQTASFYQPDNSMNDTGTLVWSAKTGNGLNIFQYDGNDIIQLTDNTEGNVHPVINEKGQVAWVSFKGVYFYDGTSTIKLATGSWSLRPHLNDLGQVVWADSRGIRLYDGNQILTISQGGRYPQINNNGHITWSGKYPNLDIHLYDGSNINIIGSGNSPRINEKNQVAWWVSSPGSGYALFFYDGTTATKIADNLSYSYPDISNIFDINDQGHLCWIETHYIDNNRALEFVLYVHDGTDITNEIVLGSEFMSPQFNSIDMNDRGDIVWRYRGDDDGDDEIYLAQAASNNPPVLTAIPEQIVFEGELLEFTVTASDIEGDNIIYAINSLPEGATFDNSAGTFRWVPDNSQAGSYTITVVATDDGNPPGSDTKDVVITVIDVPTADELINKVINDLVTINLPKQDMNAYLANLKKVESLILEEKYNVAINQLNAFIRKVAQDMTHNDAITPDGQHFIDLAVDLIDLINNL